MLGKVWGAVKRSVKKVKNTVKNACSKVMSSVSGKKHFDEAERLYTEIISNYEDKKNRYRSQLEEKTKLIRLNIEKINSFKSQIFEKLFPKFICVANRLHHVQINGSHLEELFADNLFDYKEHDGIQSREKLFEIDFNEMSFKQAAYSILTLGFYSRKKAKQSLQQVRDEEQKVKEEIAKLDAQLKKVDVVNISISNVVGYFDSLILSYDKLLRQFEFGVNSQRFLQARINEFEKLDFRLIPIKHIEDFHALFNLSVVMKTMSTMGYLSESGELINDDLNKASTLEAHTCSLVAA